jgi:hypothetical protein
VPTRPQAKRTKNPGRIRAELNAGPDLPKRVRLLEQEGIDATLPVGERGRDAADTAARDQDSELVSDQDPSRQRWQPLKLLPEQGTSASGAGHREVCRSPVRRAVNCFTIASKSEPSRGVAAARPRGWFDFAWGRVRIRLTWVEDAA